MRRGRIARACITIVLTSIGTTLARTSIPELWRAWADDLLLRTALTFCAVLWAVTAGVMWLHVWFDLRAALLERLSMSRIQVVVIPGRDLDV